jgi:hypothetical protein
MSYGTVTPTAPLPVIYTVGTYDPKTGKASRLGSYVVSDGRS